MHAFSKLNRFCIAVFVVAKVAALLSNMPRHALWAAHNVARILSWMRPTFWSRSRMG